VHMQCEYVNLRIIAALKCVFGGQPGQLEITMPAADMSGEWRYKLFSLVISILIKRCERGS
jgi:hypothetical protein